MPFGGYKETVWRKNKKILRNMRILYEKIWKIFTRKINKGICECFIKI